VTFKGVIFRQTWLCHAGQNRDPIIQLQVGDGVGVNTEHIGKFALTRGKSPDFAAEIRAF
jgi:hypothetical protein